MVHEGDEEGRRDEETRRRKGKIRTIGRTVESSDLSGHGEDQGRKKVQPEREEKGRTRKGGGRRGSEREKEGKRERRGGPN